MSILAMEFNPDPTNSGEYAELSLIQRAVVDHVVQDFYDEHGPESSPFEVLGEKFSDRWSLLLICTPKFAFTLQDFLNLCCVVDSLFKNEFELRSEGVLDPLRYFAVAQRVDDWKLGFQNLVSMEFGSHSSTGLHYDQYLDFRQTVESAQETRFDLLKDTLTEPLRTKCKSVLEHAEECRDFLRKCADKLDRLGALQKQERLDRQASGKGNHS